MTKNRRLILTALITGCWIVLLSLLNSGIQTVVMATMWDLNTMLPPTFVWPTIAILILVLIVVLLAVPALLIWEIWRRP
ncbi:MAG: hypothetical protein ACPG3W_08980 [Synechococcus sp.]|uniref:hypothetical protein n=1 Tax=unclassified Synechococcus TaxID=2626047 RepID=UPI00015252BD|nr:MULTISPECIES: hypothetical protein [unclassified Synechococcus]MCT0251296.1 hypothetical protein [Synechococcus sp. CS-197]PTU01791.1 hypothetical protein DBR45_15675 [Pseudomonas sp. HMWF031]QNI68390.1 putative membrane protein [Synechococcus sp. BMK-MC-1]CAK24349.1 Hypothetical membrane protein [Synechococcus sp. WH 7803]